MVGFRKSAAEVLVSGILGCAACLLAVALFAVFVRAYAPSDLTVTIVCRSIECAVIFLACLLCLRGERALFKGLAAGILTVVLTMLLFGWIGGFRLTPFFLLELLLGGVFGGLGALCGKKFRKE